MIDELNVREFIERGIKKPLFFYHPAYEKPLKFRPLGDLEIHECFNKPLNDLKNEESVKAYMQLRTKGYMDFDVINFFDINIKAVTDAMDTFMAWMIYYATRDFQDDDYSIDDVKKLKGISDLGHLIMKVSGNTEEATDLINKFLSSPQGESLAYLINFRGYKLAELQELTHLQKKFLIKADPDSMAARKKWELQGKGPNVIDFTDPEQARQQFRAMFEAVKD